MSGKRGRPRIGNQINIAMPDELLSQVDEAAAEAGVSRAEWVRQAVDASLRPRPETPNSAPTS